MRSLIARTGAEIPARARRDDALRLVLIALIIAVLAGLLTLAWRIGALGGVDEVAPATRALVR